MAHFHPMLRKKRRQYYGNLANGPKDHWKFDVWEDYDPRTGRSPTPRTHVNGPRDWAETPLTEEELKYR